MACGSHACTRCYGILLGDRADRPVARADRGQAQTDILPLDAGIGLPLDAVISPDDRARPNRRDLFHPDHARSRQIPLRRLAVFTAFWLLHGIHVG